MEETSDEFSLFRASPYYGNVVLNFQHSAMDEFGVYAHAFHKAGQKLVESMFALPTYNGADTCPIVFVYRHALELYLKAIAFLGTKIARLNGEETSNSEQLLRKHRLLPFLSMIRRTFDRVGWTWESEIEELRTFDDFGQLLQELESVDPGSYTFRYPVDKTGQASVPHHFIFHIPTFCQRMDALLDMLETAVMGLEVTYDDMCEAIANSLENADCINDYDTNG
jgi:hypothetical protein